MNYIDLFHGIGGFALGAHWAGMRFENHFCSDIEPYCQKLYAMRFPDSIQLGDITKIDTEKLKREYPGEWILSGGFPCQDISIAGKGAGITGSRSGLWFEYWRLIRDLRPRFAIMENVGMLVHRGLREVLGSLAEIGYDAEWQDIRASDMGAPHKRERIWIVGYPGECGCDRESRRRTGTEFEDRYMEMETGNVADTGLLGQAECEKQATGIEQCGKDISDTMRFDVERDVSGGVEKSVMGQRIIQDQWGFEIIREREYWSTEPAVGRLAHGIPSRVDRLKGLGNAIVPQIAELLFRQVKELL